MDFMKVLDQTVREIKREVNLKVLKVPEIEQKVLDATSDEPWGPHGSALLEIAQATKKFSECQMIMNVLWTRLTDTGANWRHVYKALAVIEYLIANGSERAVDDILEHSFRISSLSGFEYVEPNGKDVGINVRKKVETLVALITDKEKIQAVRNKAAATRDKYFGLSSSGISYKSSASSYSSSGNYGGFGSSSYGDSFKDRYNDSEGYGKETKSNYNKSKDDLSRENDTGRSKKGASRPAKSRDSLQTNSSKAVKMPAPVLSSKSANAEPSISEDDFDDFDPRGTTTGGSSNPTSNQVDLFGESLVGDLMDAPTSAPSEPITLNNTGAPDADLFANAAFVSAPPQMEAASDSPGQTNVDLFSSQPAVAAPVAKDVDLFGAPDSSLLSSELKTTAAFDPFAASSPPAPADTNSSPSESASSGAFDPFAAIPLNNFEGSDSFGAFTSNSKSSTTEPQQNKPTSSPSSTTSSPQSKPSPKKETFQVKSGIWADSLSRGLIDLNITAPKKVNLADVGIVGGLGDAADEKEKGPSVPWYMGHAMGAGSGLGISGFSSSTATQSGGSVSTLGQQQQQYGGFK